MILFFIMLTSFLTLLEIILYCGPFYFLLSQVAVMVGLQYVNTSLSTLVNPEDPESESEGWVLEKTVKETFTDIIIKMKAMGKSNQVEEGVEAQAVSTVS